MSKTKFSFGLFVMGAASFCAQTVMAQERGPSRQSLCLNEAAYYCSQDYAGRGYSSYAACVAEAFANCTPGSTGGGGGGGTSSSPPIIGGGPGDPTTPKCSESEDFCEASSPY